MLERRTEKGAGASSNQRLDRQASDLMDSRAALIRYDAARMALAECAQIDDAADIRDKAAALAAYTRQRDDKDMECWIREIHLRACVRIRRTRARVGYSSMLVQVA